MSRVMLELSGIGKTFEPKFHRRRGRSSIRAVDGVTFTVNEGESVGLAGESGSGKSTLARIILHLERPTQGMVSFSGIDVLAASGKELITYRRQVQAVFQDSSSALSPRMRIQDIVAEPLQVQQPGLHKIEIGQRIAAALKQVGLSADLGQRFPHELSGGQKQRVAIARSLIVNPSMLILDEPVSALDVSVRSQVLNLLLDLQQAHGLTYLLIAHDLAMLRHVTTRLFIMYMGRIVEQGPTEDILFQPLHPYTQMLVSAVPQLKPGRKRLPARLNGEGMEVSNGCLFAPRCPSASAICQRKQPHLQVSAMLEPGTHAAACHLLDINRYTEKPDS